MNQDMREAYASFVSGVLAVDDSCKVSNQLITRGQALLIADKLADYQMNYLAEHTQRQTAEIRQISGEDGIITLPAISYTTFNKKWADSLTKQKAMQDAENAAKKAEEEKKAAQQEKKTVKQEELSQTASPKKGESETNNLENTK